MKKALKRLTCIILILVMTLTLLPAPALGLVGAMSYPNAADTDEEVRYREAIRPRTAITSMDDYKNSHPAGKYHILYNDYICFVLGPKGCTSTVSSREFKGLLVNIEGTGNSQDVGFMVQQFPVTERHSFRYDPNYDGSSRGSLTQESLTTSKDGNKLKAVYTFTNGVKATVTYELVRVDDGLTEGSIEDLTHYDRGTGILKKDETTTGDAENWGVRMSVTYSLSGSQNMPTLVTEHIDFAGKQIVATNSTPSITEYKGAVKLSERDYEASNALREYVIKRETDMAQTAYYTGPNREITEAFTDSFNVDNQFVALNNYGFSGEHGDDPENYVAGHWNSGSHNVNVNEYPGGHYASELAWQKGKALTDFNGMNKWYFPTLTTYNVPFIYNNFRTPYVDELWGFREMYDRDYTLTTNTEVFIPGYEYTVPEGDDYLGIVKDGNTLSAVSASGESTLKNAHGDKLKAVFRGSFSKSSDGGTFTFLGGTAALSPSLTAIWGSDGYLKVSSAGVVEAKNVSLVCPAMTFYSPNAEDTSLTFSFSNGFSIGMTPANNKATLNIEIPGSTWELSSVLVKQDGDLEFGGTMGISTPMLDIADIEVQKLGMGYRSGGFGVNGIKGAGSVTIPSILSLDPIGQATADIDTFSSNPHYKFKLKLDVQGLFAADFELELARLKNGALMPDDLVIAGSSTVGVPLVPPVVVAELTGLKGGFRDLAKTVKGDFFVLPPLKLVLGAQAEVLQMLTGWGTLTVGVGRYGLELSDPKFFGLKLGAKYTEDIYLTAEKRMYKGKTYTGLAVGGGRSLELKLPSEALNILQVDSGVAIDAFAGLNGNNVHLDLNGNGKVAASVRIPSKIGSLKIPSPVGGAKLTNTQLALSLGTKTVLEEGKSVWNAVKNATNKATLTYSKKIGTVNVTITAAFHKKNVNLDFDGWIIDEGVNIGWGSSSSSSSSSSSGPSLLEAGEHEDAYYAIFVDTNTESLGSTGGVQLMSVVNDGDSLNGTGISMTPTTTGDESSYDVTLASPAVPGNLLFTLTPDGDYDEAAMKTMFTVREANATDPITLSFPDVSNLTITDESGIDAYNTAAAAANAYYSAAGTDINGITFPASVTIALPSTGTWTISAADAGAPVNFDIECIGVTPAEEIDNNGKIINLKDGKDYVLRAYLVDGDGKYYQLEKDPTSDQSVSEVVAANNSVTTTIFPVNASTTYDSVPTGSYTLVYRLYLKTTSSSATPEDFYTYLDEQVTTTTITNTNPNDLPAPTNVTLTNVGGEKFKVTWTAPTFPEGTVLKGYNVSLEQFVGAEWVDTGAAYEVLADAATGIIPTELTISPTVHGASGSYDIIGSFTETTDELLTAGKTYRVKVAAFTEETVKAPKDTDGNGTIEDAELTVMHDVTMPRLGMWAESSGVQLAAAQYPVLTYSPDTTTNPSSNMKELYVKIDDTISVTSDVDAVFTVTRMDTDALLNLRLPTLAGEYYINFDIPDFTGSLMLKITAKRRDTNNALTGDVTVDYITLLRDDTPPIVTFSEDTFTAADDGSFSVSGITEPGISLKLDVTDDTSAPVGSLTGNAGADGSFTLSGRVSSSAVPGSLTASVTATDVAENSGSASAVLLWTPSYTDGGAPAPTPTPESEWENPFTDVSEDAWYYEAVRYMCEKGLMNGVEDDEFKPRDPMTRAMLVTVIHRLAGEPKPAGESSMTDVPDGKWYSDPILWACENGIVDGFSEDVFGPGHPVTREQIVTILYRFAVLMGLDVSAAGDVSGFGDAGEISKWSAEAMAWAIGSGLMEGRSDTLLAPKEEAQRAEVAALLQRFIETFMEKK